MSGHQSQNAIDTRSLEEHALHHHPHIPSRQGLPQKGCQGPHSRPVLRHSPLQQWTSVSCRRDNQPAQHGGQQRHFISLICSAYPQGSPFLYCLCIILTILSLSETDSNRYLPGCVFESAGRMLEKRSPNVYESTGVSKERD